MPEEISAKVMGECTGAVDHPVARILKCVSSIDQEQRWIDRCLQKSSSEILIAPQGNTHFLSICKTIESEIHHRSCLTDA